MCIWIAIWWENFKRKFFGTILLILEYSVWKYFIVHFLILHLFLFFSCDQWILPSRRDSSCQTKRSIWTFISSQIYKFSNQLSFKTSTKFYILWRYYYHYHHGGIFALRKFPSLNLLFFLNFTNQKFFIVEQFVEYECVCYGSTTTV